MTYNQFSLSWFFNVDIKSNVHIKSLSFLNKTFLFEIDSIRKNTNIKARQRRYSNNDDDVYKIPSDNHIFNLREQSVVGEKVWCRIWHRGHYVGNIIKAYNAWMVKIGDEIREAFTISHPHPQPANTQH